MNIMNITNPLSNPCFYKAAGQHLADLRQFSIGLVAHAADLLVVLLPHADDEVAIIERLPTGVRGSRALASCVHLANQTIPKNLFTAAGY